MEVRAEEDFLEEVVTKLRAEGTQASPHKDWTEGPPGRGHSLPDGTGAGGTKRESEGVGMECELRPRGVQHGGHIGRTVAGAGTASGGWCSGGEERSWWLDQSQPFMKSLHPSSCRLSPEQASCFFGLQGSSVYTCSPACPPVIRSSSDREGCVVGHCLRLLLIVKMYVSRAFFAHHLVHCP